MWDILNIIIISLYAVTFIYHSFPSKTIIVFNCKISNHKKYQYRKFNKCTIPAFLIQSFALYQPQ